MRWPVHRWTQGCLACCARRRGHSGVDSESSTIFTRNKALFLGSKPPNLGNEPPPVPPHRKSCPGFNQKYPRSGHKPELCHF